uniref:Ubiquitin-like domain-containing protein n=1 Tax=Coturnix japonica TaxID=93934 RepID=A0A8C2T5B3_COTJA
METTSSSRFSIFVMSLLGKIISVPVSLDDMVLDLKVKLFALDSYFYPSRSRLIHGGQWLMNEQTLRHYNITSNSIVHHFLRCKYQPRGGEFSIFVMSLLGKIISVPVSLDDMVLDLKVKLFALDSYFYPSRSRLIHGGQWLMNEQTLRHYNITSNSIVHHFLRCKYQPRGGDSTFPISVKSFSRKMISVPVSLDDTVLDLKVKLFALDSYFYPSQSRLIHGGQELMNEQTLRHYNITSNSSWRLRGDSSNI